MGLFSKKRVSVGAGAYPPVEYKPVIRQSICTGEKTACMKNLKTGKLTELMLVKSEADIEEFCAVYGVNKADIETVY